MKKAVVIALHLSYWIMYLVLCMLIVLLLEHAPAKQVLSLQRIFFSVQSCFFLYPAFLGFYGFYTIVFPYFIQSRKFWAAAAVGVGMALFTGLLGWGLMAIFSPSTILRSRAAAQVPIILAISLMSGMHGIFGLVIKGCLAWYDESTQRLQLMEKNHQLESNLIKSQLNPHFLFNTINNIDVLIARDADMASRYLHQLSDLMRYMLYETKAEQVPLAQELIYIEKYIALQKLRTFNEDYVQFVVSGAPGNIIIAPMMFIPYIENAFKHATDKKRTHAIRIHIEIEAQRIIFNCTNIYQHIPLLPHHEPGIGNQLLQQRLALLYPGRHHLETSQENGDYHVRLTLQTHEN